MLPVSIIVGGRKTENNLVKKNPSFLYSYIEGGVFLFNKKLTVNDFVNIAKQYNMVCIEIAPGKLESLNQTSLDFTNVMDLMSLSLKNTLSDPSAFRKQFGDLIETHEKLSTQDIKNKLFNLLTEQDVMHIIKYDEYDIETLDAYKLYCQIERGE